MSACSTVFLIFGLATAPQVDVLAPFMVTHDIIIIIIPRFILDGIAYRYALRCAVQSRASFLMVSLIVMPFDMPFRDVGTGNAQRQTAR